MKTSNILISFIAGAISLIIIIGILLPQSNANIMDTKKKSLINSYSLCISHAIRDSDFIDCGLYAEDKATKI